MSFNCVTEEYSFCFLRFNKGWSVVSVQNNCPSSKQSILNRAQSKIDDGASPTDACGLHKKSVDTSHGCSKPFTEPTRSGDQTTRSWSLLNMHVTFDLSEIEKTLPWGLNSKEATWGRAGDKLLFPWWCLLSVYSSFGQSSPVHSPVQSRVQVLQRPLWTVHRLEHGLVPFFTQ